MNNSFCGINNFSGSTPQDSAQYLETKYVKSATLVACNANVGNLNASKILINGELPHTNILTTGTDDLQITDIGTSLQLDVGQAIETNYLLAGQSNYSMMTGSSTARCTVLGITSNGFDGNNKTDGVAIGYNSKLMTDAVSIGSEAQANTNGISIGKSSKNNGENSISIGWGTTSESNSIAIGHTSNARDNSVVIGYIAGTSIGKECTIVGGEGAGNSSGDRVTIIGLSAGQDSPDDCIAIGYKSGSTGYSNTGTVCIGNNCARPNASKRLAFGNNMEAPYQSASMPNGGTPDAYIKFEWNGKLYYLPVFESVST